MAPSGFFRIDYDMMRKGNITMRKRTPIRQFCVTVDGASRLVTSGDTVDRKTYLALVAAGAIDPIPEAMPSHAEEHVAVPILEADEPIDMP